MASDNVLKITEWAKNQTIFITGVTGFIGKVLLYKLLKSCPDIKTVYVLLRSKKDKPASRRLVELTSNEMFQEFKLNQSDVLGKIKAIEGDISEERLGIKDQDWELLQREVTTVFHIAASVRFDDSLKKAIFTNTRSTKYAILLAKGMKNIKAFVHVSTAYTNCRFSRIPEKVILTDFDPEKMIQVAEQSDEHELEVLSQRLLRNYPNTYIFTKNLAEDLVYQNRHEIPVVIVRPAIVVSAVKEPKPGWCDSLSSICALMAAVGKGVMRVNYGYGSNILDFTAVDTCSNTIIASAWYRDVIYPTGNKGKYVFNVTDFNLTLEDLTAQFINIQYRYPLRQQLWTAMSMYYPNTISFHVMTYLLHVLPGLLIDGLLQLNEKKPMLMKVYRKLYGASINLATFMFNTFKFDTENFKMLGKLIPKEEQNIFFTDTLAQETRIQYFSDAAVGARKLIGDPPEVYQEDIIRAKRLYWIDKFFRVGLVAGFLWMLPLKSTLDWTLMKIDQFQLATDVL